MCLDQYFLKQKILSRCYVITCNSLLLSSLPWALYQLEGRKAFIPMKYFISGICCQRWCSLHSLRFSEITVDEATVARFNLVYLILPWAGGKSGKLLRSHWPELCFSTVILTERHYTEMKETTPLPPPYTHFPSYYYIVNNVRSGYQIHT